MEVRKRATRMAAMSYCGLVTFGLIHGCEEPSSKPLEPIPAPMVEYQGPSPIEVHEGEVSVVTRRTINHDDRRR